jgi:hypothetical protein
MTTTWTFVVGDPFVFLPELRTLGCQLARWRCLETVMSAPGVVKREWFRTELHGSNVTVWLEEYPFARFLCLTGTRRAVQSLAKALGVQEADALTMSVEALFARWRAARGLPVLPHLRFEDFAGVTT